MIWKTLLMALWAADPVAIEPRPELGLAMAVKLDRTALVHTAQIFPAGPAVVPTSPSDQVSQAFSQLRDELKHAESQLSDVVKLNVYVAHATVTAHVERELKSRFQNLRWPAVSFVETELPHPGTVVALDAVAVTSKNIEQVAYVQGSTKGQPARLGILPAGSVSYISGQAERGDGSVLDATRSTMHSLLKTLAFLGRQPQDVVQIKAFLTPVASADMAIQAIQTAFGDAICPPISVVQWESNLPIEIELIVADRPLAGVDPNGLPMEYLTPPEMTASPIYARVTRVHAPQRIYISGLFAEAEVPAAEEVTALFATLSWVLESSGSDLRHLAKATYYVAHDDTSRELNRQRPMYYDPQRPPAASKALVVGTGRAGRNITFDMLAVPAPR